MSDLKITKGVACAEKYNNSWTVNCGIYPVATRSGWLPGLDEENFANADVIAETFNVAYETGLTPKQLLEQRDELIKLHRINVDTMAVTKHRLSEKGSPSSELEVAIRETEQAIAKAEGRS